MGVGDVVYHGAADVYRKINETGFSRPSDQSAAAFVVTHAWAVCLIGEPCLARDGSLAQGPGAGGHGRSVRLFMLPTSLPLTCMRTRYCTFDGLPTQSHQFGCAKRPKTWHAKCTLVVAARRPFRCKCPGSCNQTPFLLARHRDDDSPFRHAHHVGSYHMPVHV